MTATSYCDAGGVAGVDQLEPEGGRDLIVARHEVEQLELVVAGVGAGRAAGCTVELDPGGDDELMLG